MKDRRHFARVHPERHLPIRVDLNGADFLDVFYAVDISCGGIGSWVPHHFNECRTDRMVECLVKLPAPFNKSFRAQGKMRHIVDGHFGIEFKNLNENTKLLINEYVDYQLHMKSWWAWVAQSRFSPQSVAAHRRAA